MIPETTYHIYNHANGTENIFAENENYLYFLRLYRKHIVPIAKTFAYCLLPNHFHILLSIREASELDKTFPKFQTLEKMEKEKKLSKQFANLFSAYTQAFNNRYNRRGSLFRKNFKRKSIESDEQWQETFLYIHLNPVKHGFVAKTEDWPWSSRKAYELFEKASLLDRTEALKYFGSYENLFYCLGEKRDNILSLSME